MDVGIKQAKTSLSQLIVEVQKGKRVFLTNRGKRIVELVTVSTETTAEKDNRGLGAFKHKISLSEGWDSEKAKKESTDAVLELMGIDR